MRRVIVTGGRDFCGRCWLWSVLDQEHARDPVGVIVHGGATGADAHADAWARSRMVDVEAHPAIWRRPDGSTDYGAGPRRNAKMVELGADLVIVTPGGRGTADCHMRALAGGVATRILTFTPRSIAERDAASAGTLAVMDRPVISACMGLVEIVHGRLSSWYRPTRHVPDVPDDRTWHTVRWHEPCGREFE